MKVIHLNLASRPYRDYRPVYAVAAVLAVLTAILMVYNLQTAYRYFVNTSETREKIELTEAKIREEQQKASAADEKLSSVDIASLNREATFINLQIAERAFSWTQLLDRLERVFPADVRLVSLNPNVDENGETHLQMSCVAKNYDGIVSLIDRMNADPHFSRPFPQSQTERDGQFFFNLRADYAPAAEVLAR
ncbi:MAG TPA: PilN domain-containing protein [Thermoanaerobaculia bacterium]|nr:PilN domain-containing protein [Thermoanaerobaculia bacterium]